MLNKKIAGIAFSFMLIAGLAVPSYAQTKEYTYNLKIGENETSFAATKAGGSSFENKFYVRQTFTACPPGNSTTFVYHPRYNGVKMANNVKLKGSETEKKSYNTYLSGKAVAGRSYKLRCKVKDSNSSHSGYTTVKGRCPFIHLPAMSRV